MAGVARENWAPGWCPGQVQTLGIWCAGGVSQVHSQATVLSFRPLWSAEVVLSEQS